MTPLELIGAISLILATASGLVAAAVGLRRWMRPIRIRPSIVMSFSEKPDEIAAEITNVSRDTQHLVKCAARSTYPLRSILVRHLQYPFIRPRLYPNIWFSGVQFELLDSKTPRALAPNERIHLRHRRSSHPLSVFLSSHVLVEAELSTGRRFRSGRLEVPVRWRLIRKVEPDA